MSRLALFLFTINILAGEPIKLFCNGDYTRDFNNVEDIAKGVIRASDFALLISHTWSIVNRKRI